MRTKNSIKNMYVGIMSQIIIVMVGFISRKVFLDTLGTEYLGINGLLNNVISMLALVETGIGTSIVYNLYKPLHEQDTPKIISLIQLYKKSYFIIAGIIFICSCLLYPFLGIIVEGIDEVKYLTTIYFLFVLRNIIPYLNAHRTCLINADQKGYVLSRINLIFNISTTIVKIIILKLTQNYVLFLIVDLMIFIGQTIYISRVIDNRYPYIKTKNKYSIDLDIKTNIIKNIKALFLHNVGNYCVFGTDNLLISAFINLYTVGIYSNYSMIIGQISGFAYTLIGSMSESVGNLIATESKEKSYNIFNVIYLMNFWIYSFATIALYNLTEPFINLWLGNGYLLDKITFIIILLNFYITGLRVSIIIFKTKSGIFTQDKWIPIIEAIVNLMVSIILVKKIGLAGIFLGTTVSTLCIQFWNMPRLVYKHAFNLSGISYFKKYMYYFALTIVACIITSFICNNFIINNKLICFLYKVIVCSIVPNIIFIITLFRTEEFKYLMNIIKNNSSKQLKYELNN